MLGQEDLILGFNKLAIQGIDEEHRLYKLHRITLSNFIKAILRNGSDLFFTYIHDLDFDQSIVEYAVKYGRREEVRYLNTIGYNVVNMIAKYGDMVMFNEIVDLHNCNITEIVSYAAEGGQFDLVEMLLMYDIIDYSRISYYCALYGNRFLLDRLIIRRRVKDYNLIAIGAVLGGHNDIVIDMISRGANNYSEIISKALECGNRDIVNILKQEQLYYH